MDIFSLISLAGGLALFLYGMSVLGSSLERAAGSNLSKILEGLTNNIFKSVAFGAVVTAAIQSSSATTVIVVGLVNSQIINLKQAIGVIMGANIGTTITAHILRLTDIGSDNFFLMLIKPTTLAPVAAIVGIMLYMGSKKSRLKDLGQVLLGFGILFTGMFNMEAAVAGLRTHPAFFELFSTLSNPILGVLVGAIVTAIIQSSSASVGILQALCSTGQISFASAFPIIMGQNIGTCITPILASIGASKNAKRSAVVHLSFNIIGTAVFLIATYLIQSTIGFEFWDQPIDKGGIANFHTVFNITVTLLFIPFVSVLEKIAKTVIKDKQEETDVEDIAMELDERFLVAPSLAIEHCTKVTANMGLNARENFLNATSLIKKYDPKIREIANEMEDIIDMMQDKLSIYLLKLSKKDLNENDSRKVSQLLHISTDFERIGDYATNMMEFAQTMNEKDVSFSPEAIKEFDTISDAVLEIIDIANDAFIKADTEVAINIEPLEEVIDIIEETLKDRHINRLRDGLCTIDAAFPFVESLSSMERIADHCSNVGVYIISHENPKTDLDMHEYIKTIHKGETEHFSENYLKYEEKYYSRIS
ncbi:MAG: Na/Pi cotransporter family protein [Oscillospiraceae bacterium]